MADVPQIIVIPSMQPKALMLGISDFLTKLETGGSPKLFCEETCILETLTCGHDLNYLSLLVSNCEADSREAIEAVWMKAKKMPDVAKARKKKPKVGRGIIMTASNMDNGQFRLFFTPDHRVVTPKVRIARTLRLFLPGLFIPDWLDLVKDFGGNIPTIQELEKMKRYLSVIVEATELCCQHSL